MKISKEIKMLSLVMSVAITVSAIIYFFVKGEGNTTVGASQKLEVSIDNFYEGPSDAKVSVVEFFDPECESCAAVSPYIKNEMNYYKGKVRWTFRYMAYHPSSSYAIRILEAARKQKLYLEAMSLLLKTQNEWASKHDGTVQTSKDKTLLEIISRLPGINLAQLEEDMKNPQIDKLIENDKRDGTASGVTGTPTFFVNGKIIEPLSLDTMIEKINEGLK